MAERGEITDVLGIMFCAIVLGVGIFGVAQCQGDRHKAEEATKQKQIELEMMKIEKGIVDE